MLAEEGYWVATPDLYQGRTATTLEEGLRLRTTLEAGQVVSMLEEGYKLLTHEASGVGSIGFLGFCMGGGFALLGGCEVGGRFVVDYYGMMDEMEKLKNVNGPIQLILASEDRRVTPWAYRSFMPTVVRYRKRADIHIYPYTQHAFHRPNWAGHNPEAARDAWSKTLAFLSQFR